MLCAPSSPNDLLKACSRARLVAPLKCRSNPARVNRPSTLKGAAAPIANLTGCNNSAEGPASGVSHLTRTGANTNGLPPSGGVKLSEARVASPAIKGDRSPCEV